MGKFSGMSKRMWIVVLCLCAAFGYVVFKLYQVQVMRHEELFAKARAKYTTVTRTAGNRGEIYDRDGCLLVGNEPCSDVCVDPSLAGSEKNCQEIALLLSKELGVSADEVYDKLMDRKIVSRDEKGSQVTRERKFAIIQPRVGYDTAERLKKITAERGMKAVFYRETVKRVYPKKHLLANILGFTSMDRDNVIPLVGLEKFMDKTIRGTGGEALYERSRDGLPISYGRSRTREEQDGLNIYLTVSEPIQAIVEEELDKVMYVNNPRAAYAVMADPFTGEILAAAQRPTFNPNDLRHADPEALRNRIAEDTFEPGSAMKPIAISGAVDHGIVTPETVIDCEGGYWAFAGRPLKDDHKLKLATVTQVIQASSNIGTAKIGIMMGRDVLHETFTNFGIGARTGIELKGETRGQYRGTKNWRPIYLSRFPIGQGVAVSPLQLVRAYCMIANGGHPIRLTIVSKTVNPATGSVTTGHQPMPPSFFRRRSTHFEMVTMMKTVMDEGGTGHKASIRGYYAAGKTGTAQKFDLETKNYSKTKYFADFIGFVPADHPRFVLLVAVDEPHGRTYYGASVAGPAFKAIAERTLKFLSVPPDYDADAADAMKKSLKKNRVGK